MTAAVETAAVKKVWTETDFMALTDDGNKYELVNGELVVGNAGMEHGNMGTFLGGALELYVRSRKLGAVCDSSTGFRMQSGNVRSPDVSFVSRERLQGLKRLPKGFFQGAPALAVEILSPGNTVEEIHTKIVEYFENGAQLVWVINPDEQYVLVYHAPKPDQFLRVGDSLDGEALVVGFSLAVAELFTEWEF